METINKEGIVFGLCTPEVQAALEQALKTDNKIYMYYCGVWNGFYDKTFDLGHAYKAEIPESKLIPWEPHEFMGKYIRRAGHVEASHQVPMICTLAASSITTNSCYGTPEWWLENGECLQPDGTIGPCGKEISE